MKKFATLLTFFTIFLNSSLLAQDVIRLQPCEDASMLKQADSLKQLFAKEGYAVFKEASIMMESEYEMPVIVPLQERNMYQFVFIGDITSRLYEVRMYD